MAIYRVLDNHIVSRDEFRARSAELADFLSARDAGTAKGPLALSGDRLLAATAPTLSTPFAGALPIGKGLPLMILIRDVYTGKYPDRVIDKDVAVVSSVKNFDTFNASTRALNFLVQKQSTHSHMRTPSAPTGGTALVAYSPAILTDSMTVTFEFAVASFFQELIDALSSSFNTLSGIPVLLPDSGYLLGAQGLLKLAGNAAHALFDGVRFTVDGEIDFDLGTPTGAGLMILAPDDLDMKPFTYVDGKGLIDGAGKAYAGDTPYVAILLDGKQRDNLKSFTPTAASSAVLQKFFQLQDGATVAVDTVVQGLQLVSDLKYRDQAVNLKGQIATAPPADQPALQKQLDAVLRNILTAALKP